MPDWMTKWKIILKALKKKSPWQLQTDNVCNKDVDEKMLAERHLRREPDFECSVYDTELDLRVRLQS